MCLYVCVCVCRIVYGLFEFNSPVTFSCCLVFIAIRSLNTSQYLPDTKCQHSVTNRSPIFEGVSTKPLFVILLAGFQYCHMSFYSYVWVSRIMYVCVVMRSVFVCLCVCVGLCVCVCVC